MTAGTLVSNGFSLARRARRAARRVLTVRVAHRSQRGAPYGHASRRSRPTIPGVRLARPWPPDGRPRIARRSGLKCMCPRRQHQARFRLRLARSTDAKPACVLAARSGRVTGRLTPFVFQALPRSARQDGARGWLVVLTVALSLAPTGRSRRRERERRRDWSVGVRRKPRFGAAVSGAVVSAFRNSNDD